MPSRAILLAVPAVPRHTTRNRAVPRLACQSVPRHVIPNQAHPSLPCCATPCRAIRCRNIPSHACLATPVQTQSSRTLPRLALPAMLYLASPSVAQPLRAMPAVLSLTAPRRAKPSLACRNKPRPATTHLAAPALAFSLLDAELGFDSSLSVALHYLEQTEPTSGTSLTVGSACTNPYLQAATTHKVNYIHHLKLIHVESDA